MTFFYRVFFTMFCGSGKSSWAECPQQFFSIMSSIKQCLFEFLLHARWQENLKNIFEQSLTALTVDMPGQVLRHTLYFVMKAEMVKKLESLCLRFTFSHFGVRDCWLAGFLISSGAIPEWLDKKGISCKRMPFYEISGRGDKGNAFLDNHRRRWERCAASLGMGVWRH